MLSKALPNIAKEARIYVNSDKTCFSSFATYAAFDKFRDPTAETLNKTKKLSKIDVSEQKSIENTYLG